MSMALSAWGRAWGYAWGAAWGPVQVPTAGAMAGQRPGADSQRPAITATMRQDALQTAPRADQLATTQRPEPTDTERFIATAAQRGAQIHISSRPAQAGGRRK